MVPSVCPLKPRLAADAFSARREGGHSTPGPSPHREGPCGGPRPGLGGHMTCHHRRPRSPGRLAAHPPAFRPPWPPSGFCRICLDGGPRGSSPSPLSSKCTGPHPSNSVLTVAQRAAGTINSAVSQTCLPQASGAFPPAEAGLRDGRGLRRRADRVPVPPLPPVSCVCSGKYLASSGPQFLQPGKGSRDGPRAGGREVSIIVLLFKSDCAARRASAVVPHGVVSLDDPTFSPYLLPPTANKTCRSGHGTLTRARAVSHTGHLEAPHPELK